jgi:hypothetical protein
LSAPGQNAFGQQFAIDGAGNAVAVWRRSDGSDYVVQSSWSSDGGQNWSTPEDLSAPGQDAYGLQDVYSQWVAIDGAGSAVAVWGSSDGSDYVVQSSWSSDGGMNWSTPEDLSAPGQDAYDAQVAVNDAGNAVAVWRRYDGSDDVVQFSGSSDGGASWSTPVTLSRSGQDAYGARIAISDADNAVAVWRRYDGSNYVVQSSGSWDGGVTWSTPATLSRSGANVSSMQVAVDGSGNAVAAWARFTGVNAVQSSGSSDGGVSWSTPVNLSAPGQNAGNPQVAADGAGNAVAVWQRLKGSNYVVQSSGSSNFGSGGEELAPTGAGGFVNNTALVASVGLLALGVLTRVFVRRRGVESGR